jgi:hypothetical protein
VLLVAALQAGAAPGGGCQNDGRRIHRVHALIPCLHLLSLAIYFVRQSSFHHGLNSM